MNEFTLEKVIMGRLEQGDDLLEELNRLVGKHNIKSGTIKVIGAVKKAHYGFYDQSLQEYKIIKKEKPLEILNVTGNISIYADKPMVHAHITLADKSGNVFGGHLADGTEVFAAEVILRKFSGKPLKRVYEENSGLTLWEE